MKIKQAIIKTLIPAVATLVGAAIGYVATTSSQQSQITELRIASDGLQIKLGNCNQALDLERHQATGVRDQLREEEREAGELRTKNIRLSTELSHRNQENQRLASEFEHDRDRTTQLEGQLANEKRESTNLRATKAQLAADIARRDQSIARLNTSLDDQRLNITRLTQELSEMRIEVRSLRTSNTALATELTLENEENARLQAVARDATAKLTRLDGELNGVTVRPDPDPRYLWSREQ